MILKDNTPAPGEKPQTGTGKQIKVNSFHCECPNCKEKFDVIPADGTHIFKPTPGQSIKTAEANKNYCTLTNEELAISARQWLERLIQTGGRDWCLPVPANPNKDVDLILAEIIHRFLKLNHSPTEAEINEAAESSWYNQFQSGDTNPTYDQGFRDAVQWLQNYQQQQPNPAIAVIEAELNELLQCETDCKKGTQFHYELTVRIAQTRHNLKLLKQIKG